MQNKKQALYDANVAKLFEAIGNHQALQTQWEEERNKEAHEYRQVKIGESCARIDLMEINVTKEELKVLKIDLNVVPEAMRGYYQSL